MELFILSKFKKAGQLAFLIGLIFLLNSCGGGGGSDKGNEDNPQPVTYTYKTFSGIASSIASFEAACEANPSTCTDSNAASLAQEILGATDFHTKAFHFRLNTAGTNLCGYASSSASYSMTVDVDDIRETYSFGPQLGSAVQGIQCAGADVSGASYSLKTDNINVTADFNFPGAMQGILIYDHEYWGMTDSNLNETVFVGTRVRQKNNSGIYWSGNQYVIGAIGEINFGTSCSYSSSPRRCSSVLTDQTLNADILGGLEGFKTFAGDMPSSGSASYRTFSMAKGVYGVTNFLNLDVAAAANASGCNASNPAHNTCHIITLTSISAEHFLSVDYQAKTLSGSISMQNGYVEDGYNNKILLEGDAYDQALSTLNDLVISATISGTSFSGTASNEHYKGEITGFFYGPQGKEIGALITFMQKESGSYFSSTGASGIIMINGSK